MTASDIETITGANGDDTIALAAAITGGVINLNAGNDSLTLFNGTNSLTATGIRVHHRRHRWRRLRDIGHLSEWRHYFARVPAPTSLTLAGGVGSTLTLDTTVETVVGSAGNDTISLERHRQQR